METLQQKIDRVVHEHIRITPYDPDWPRRFRQEKRHLLNCLPAGLIRRIEHFGSTAVPGLAAKPVVDMLVEVTALEETKQIIVPILESQGYDYFWRPALGDNTPPFYAWFIKRDAEGARTHHIHMVKRDFEHWDRLLFRDLLRERPALAAEYQALKLHLADQFGGDRVSYTRSKSEFIRKVTQMAKVYHKKTDP
ncbi:GrpB family protein [Desulfonema ishimotonii]|uniref:GrpB family protein n=1 Tax=Desulfonema ishimotonii TaxID=45657 RepID=A0A401FYF1_9BACT|nr:GrpB family protein [Desulfonema ishimotonii]GBC61974.1 GrpB family protein [Desulfonema ishimotonii]